MCTTKGTEEIANEAGYSVDLEGFKDQVARIETQNDLIDAHIAICQAYSAYKLTHAQFDELRNAMILKRLEKKIAWGQGI